MKYHVKDEVIKVGGDYTFEGVIVAAFHKKSGHVRYVVEDSRGLLFIFNESALRLKDMPIRATYHHVTGQEFISTADGHIFPSGVPELDTCTRVAVRCPGGGDHYMVSASSREQPSEFFYFPNRTYAIHWVRTGKVLP